MCVCATHSGVAFFAESLEKYHREHKEALAIKQKRHLGMLLVDTTQLKIGRAHV